MSESSDTHFFTNEDKVLLSDRLNSILSHDTEEFNVIVGYFYISGFYKIYKSLENVNKIRIIVGMGVEETLKSLFILEESEKNAKGLLLENLKKELENSEDDAEIELGINRFLKYLSTKKLEIKAHPSKKLHAKIYIMIKKEGSEDYGKVITGSSNLTASGLEGNLEFNVELKDKLDVVFAENKFNQLWNESLPVEDIYLDTIEQHSYLKLFTPYEIYLKTLFEYFKDLFIKPVEQIEGPEGFIPYRFQEDAVKLAAAKLEQHGGLFLSDVVGLGKTYIAAMIAKNMEAKPLVVCPPHLISYWEDTMMSFGVLAKVVSSGSLDKVLDEIERYKKCNVVFVDEAHYFRNSETKSYGFLHEICSGKKVVLISATPLNNAPMDIANQIFLFEPKYSSSLPHIPNLYGFFNRLQNNYEEIKKVARKQGNIDKDRIKAIANEIREKVLKSLMVRRTREDIKNYYSFDMTNLGLRFPEVQPPNVVYYELDKELSNLFDISVKIIEKTETSKSKWALKYAKYRPFYYLKEEGKDYLFENHYIESKYEVDQMKMSEQLLIGLMRTLLVKRLDSSFFAYKETLGHIIKSYESYLNMINAGKVVICRGVDVVDIWNRGEIEKLIEQIEQGEKEGYSIPAQYFAVDFKEHLEKDLNTLNELKSMWDECTQDPKIDTLIESLKNDSILKKEKIILFTEFEDTAEYIYKNLPDDLKEEAIQISSKSKAKKVKDAIESFDPIYRGRFKNSDKKDYRILISTEILSEGLNLNLSRVVVNYDIPWNPTRVIQRFGRVNRIGSSGEIYIYNFFPTAKAEDKIHLKQYAIEKIELFINTLGSDAKYLTEEETVNPRGLFDKINSPDFYNEKEETDDELKYFAEIRDLIEKDESLKDKLKDIPAKARTARLKNSESLLTYFKVGAENKFIFSDAENTSEILPLEAFDKLKSDSTEKPIQVNGLYYEFLKKNKTYFEEALENCERVDFRGTEGEVLTRVKFLQKMADLNEYEKEYLENLEEALRHGLISKFHIKDAKEKINTKEDYHNQVRTLQKIITPKYIDEKLSTHLSRKEKRIIISEEFIPGGRNE